MTNKKRKSKAGGGGGTGESSSAGASRSNNNAHKRPRFYERPNSDPGSSSRDGGNRNNRPNRFTNDPDMKRGYYDPNHGQFGAFPGLEDDDGEFYGPANDGVDYLKMVRSEAKSVPSLLIAGQEYQVVKPRSRPPPSSKHPVDPSDELNYDENTTDNLDYDDEPVKAPSIVEPPETNIITPRSSTPDSAGWYHDGTYTAAPPPRPPTPPPTALSLWHTVLLNSFCSFRLTFHTAPPGPPSADPPPIPPSFKFWVRQRRWQHYILHTAPTPRVLRAMSQLHVISALEALTAAPGVKKGVQGWWAEWVWGLLVRCEVCLTAEEVSVVRELGKRALNLRGRIVKGGGGHLEPEWERQVEVEVVKEEEEEEEEEEEDPVGWVEPEEEDMKEEGEVEWEEEGEIESGEDGGSELELEQAKQRAIKTLIEKMSGRKDDGPVKIEPEIQTQPKEDFVANPDAIELDESEDVTSTKADEIRPNPMPVPYTPKEKERTLADTLAALDMVISIVGDFYGQRDLLSEREGQVGLVMF